MENEPVIWQCYRQHKWIDYEKNISEIIEHAHSGHKKLTFKIDGSNYYIDWNKNEQVNATTKKRRPVRRYENKPSKLSNYSDMIHNKQTITININNNQEIAKEKIAASKQLTQWEEKDSVSENCSICLCELDNDVVRLSQCKDHYFHSQCISECFKDGFLKCPLCSIIYGTQRGIQPPGEMKITFQSHSPLSSYENVPTIRIDYSIPNGIQGPEHPNPGVPYSGTLRSCFLPYTHEAIVLLELLIVAWTRRLIFTVGTSVTTGQQNCVVWNGIHHKTAVSGGSSNYGYPDPGYFDRVTKELEAFGITTEKSLNKQ